jgi:hypothetical protein
MSNQAADHKVFLDEIKQRYGMDGHRLNSCFFTMADEADTDSPKALRSNVANGSLSFFLECFAKQTQC